MKLKAMSLLALGLLVGPAVASATAVSWLIGGQLTDVEGDLPDTIQPGYLFSFVLTFDTATGVSNPMACGSGGADTTCRHNFGTLFYSNITINGQPFGNFNPNPSDNTSIIVRNDVLWNYGTTENPDFYTVDGYTFNASENYSNNTKSTSFGLIFRGPEDTGMVTDGRQLPGYPPAGLLSLRERTFQFCDGDLGQNGIVANCAYQYIRGSITSVSSVPEPGSLALLGLGLAGLALSRRRKAA